MVTPTFLLLQVFPDIKLDFGQVSPGTPSKTQETQSPHSPLSSPLSQQLSARLSGESFSYSGEKASKESTESRESKESAEVVRTSPRGSAPAMELRASAEIVRPLPLTRISTVRSKSAEELKGSSELVHEEYDLAPTPTDSEELELAPTPKSEISVAKLHKYDVRSQFIAMPEVLPYTGLPMVPNKDNGGDLIINGVPFWVEVNQEDVTVDESVLNAAVVLEVVTGRVSLINMPDEQIVLDVYEDWKVLRSRDQKCFNKDVLFGNTVRSMVNVFGKILCM
ncbi:hypothetical protein OESDEN_21360 [Oesophagostomum dentatum]|uniref:Uncharacterized protein n=1 Tax=Oesophagostomum dentatum TaxID=61180 RepID=A0A0B1S247_OESDE|nr:hypothetical protein OESDEN_21360 [Oesophagostomum dentatum]